jgi:hypothetical protein
MATMMGPEDPRKTDEWESQKGEPAPGDGARAKAAFVKGAGKVIGVLVVIQAVWSALTTDSALLAFLGWLLALTFGLAALVS